MPDERKQCIDWIYKEIVDEFNLKASIPMHQPNIYRCTAIFKTGELSIVYAKSYDREHIIGAVIVSDSFSGTRGEISNSDFEFCQSLHDDIKINRD